jgi:cyclopropane-fatty-acyl-phospholipid synthase
MDRFRLVKAPAASAESAGEVAAALRPLIESRLGRDVALRFEFWDGSTLCPEHWVATLRFNSPDAIRRLLWMPNELGLGRAYVTGELDLDGDIFGAVMALRDSKPTTGATAWRELPTVVTAAKRVGALHRPLRPPPEEARLRGWRHSARRDSTAIGHHYDVGNDFYRLVLGPTMTYSCARFTQPEATLEQAQAAKHELVCRKLGLHEHPGARLLDVGCGWGSMAIHAAVHHDARVVGVTISRAQAELARRRVDDAGVADRVEIRLQDYRDLSGESFDAISSIGMSEHVGHGRLDRYFTTLRSVLVPKGRLLNHAISSVGGSTLGRTSFVGRYVFPDGELVDVGGVVLAMERAGFEVRDVESLREHYARTLRAWVANLESSWDQAVTQVGEARAKIWRLYMAGSAIGFDDGGISVHQVLGVVPTEAGHSAMPITRLDWT